MQIDLNIILLVVIAIELALIYIRLGQKEEKMNDSH
jgi:hypothetical protein